MVGASWDAWNLDIVYIIPTELTCFHKILASLKLVGGFNLTQLKKHAPKEIPSLKLTIIAPKNGWLEDDPFLFGGWPIFQVRTAVSFRMFPHVSNKMGASSKGKDHLPSMFFFQEGHLTTLEVFGVFVGEKVATHRDTTAG